MKAVFIGADADVAELVGLSIRLRWPNATPRVATTASDGLQIVKQTSPDVVLLQVGLSDMSLSRLLQQLRDFCNAPLIVLSHQENEAEVVTALDMGADGYVRLPCELTEMMARIWALLRRVAGNTDYEGERSPVRSGELLIKPATHEVFLDNRRVMLTPTEFRFLYLLVKNRGSVVSHQTVERTLWGEEAVGSVLAKKYVQRVREKLGDTAQNPSWIASVHGVGYRFVG